MDSGFGIAPIKREGYEVRLDGKSPTKKGKYVEPTTVYVERSVPIKYEEEIHTLIDNFLKSKGIKDI